RNGLPTLAHLGKGKFTEIAPERLNIFSRRLVFNLDLVAVHPRILDTARMNDDEIIALERAALDRWITFDPDGYLELSAPEVTYFDPYREKRIDGLQELTTILAPIKQFKGAIKEPRYEMIAPRVQRYGEIVLLTFNLTNYGKVNDAPEAVLAR